MDPRPTTLVFHPLFYYLHFSADAELDPANVLHTLALSVVIIHAVADLITKPVQAYRFWRVSPFEFFIWLAAVIATVFLSIKNGIYVSLSTSSIVLLIFKLAHLRGHFSDAFGYIRAVTHLALATSSFPSPITVSSTPRSLPLERSWPPAQCCRRMGRKPSKAGTARHHPRFFCCVSSLLFGHIPDYLRAHVVPRLIRHRYKLLLIHA